MKKGIVLSLMFLVFSLIGYAQPINKTDDNGKKHGQWVGFYEGTKLKRYQGQFEHGVPTGKFRYFFEDGKTQTVMTFSADGKSAQAKHYHQESGRISAEGKYVGQTKEGLWKYYKPDGNLLNEETYVKGQKSGEAKVYFENGKVAEISNWKNDLQHGEWKTYYDNGQVREEATYRDDNIEGLYTKYYKNGKILAQGNYRNAVKDGGWKYYEDNGNLDYQELYKDGKITRSKKENGKVASQFPDGRPKSEYLYKGGKRHGAFTEWYDNGEWVTEFRPKTETTGRDERYKFVDGQTVKVTGTYKNGVMHGEITWYNENGTVDRVETWENGTKVSTE